MELSASKSWKWLTEPAPRLKDPKQRRDARLLASLLLSSVLVLLIIPLTELLQISWVDSGIRLIAIGLSLLIVIACYVLCRLGFLKLTFAGLLGGLTVVSIGAGISRGESGVANMYYSSLLVVCAALAGSNFMALVTAIINTLGIIYFGTTLPASSHSGLLIQPPLVFLWIITPITMLFAHYRRVAEAERSKQLAESEERYRIISEAISDYAFKARFMPEGGFQPEWVTEETFERVTGYTLDEWKQQGRLFNVVPEDLPRVIGDVEHLRTTGEDIATEYRIITRTGAERWILVSRRAYRDEHGTVAGFYGVAQDITERKSIEAAKREAATLQAAYEKERELNDTKNKMMMTISHEFRTPLAEIRVASDLLLNYYDRLTPEGRVEKLNAIQSRIAHLNSMLEHVQMIVTKASGSVTLRLQVIDMDSLCRQAVQDARHKYGDKYQISYQGRPRTMIRADTATLSSAVASLIDNAVKFSPDGGSIEIELRQKGQHAILKVCDHGVGIPDEDQANLFQPFYRASNSDAFQGIGFGLTVVKDCADLHDGSVSVQSTVGKGSCFTLCIPVFNKGGQMADRNTQLQLESPYTRREPLDFAPFEAALNALTPERIAQLDERLLNAELTALRAMLNDGSLTSAELVTYSIWRIRAYDDALQSVVELNPDALELARRLDAERSKGGLGALHGIPVLLKDNINTADSMQTTAGAAVMIGFHAPEDAFIVKKLREAGAIILGKCNMSEWAFFMSSDAPSGYSFRGGQTRNPYGKFDAGGSSTGSGVALAAGFAPVTIGTETCGSLVSPACQNSIVTIKPSIALLSRSGIIPIVDVMDTAGAFTRTVADAALMLNVLAGRDERDPDTAGAVPLFGTDFRQFLGSGDLHGISIGMWRPQAEDELMDADDHAALDRAAEVLAKIGARVVNIRVEKTMPFETVFPVLTNGFRHCLNTYLAAQGESAPVKSMADVIAFNAQMEEKYAPYNQALLVDSQNADITPDEYYAFAAEKRTMTRDAIASIMKQYDVQVIASIGYNFSAYYATAGYPAIGVPCGYHDSGEPVGITFSAGYLEEPLLIRVGHAFEQAARWRRLPVLHGGETPAQG